MGRRTMALTVLGLAWAAYFALHSVLAADGVKRWLAATSPTLGSRYRLLYNLVAVVTLLPPVWLLHRAAGPTIVAWSGPLGVVADGLALVAVGVFAWSLRFYDGREFAGLGSPTGGARGLVISPLHRHVRHPWYACALVLLWTRDMDLARLLVVVLATAYFVIGSRLEERKLLAEHGEAYARYRARVPGLLPIPGRRLGAAEARELEALSRQRAGRVTR
ncbi:MAG: hypothetical protein H6983_13620 [Ectothiorhodospiraceae bacterium]|nr:hypothetical protein [Ectothiorhodospiraceae bacterium]